MNDDDLDRDGLRERLGAAAPPHPDLPGLADRVEHRARRRRTTRRSLAAGATAAAVALAVVVPLAVARSDGGRDGPVADEPSGSAAPMRDQCAAPSRASRSSLEGTPVWVRFCSGGAGGTGSGAADVPSDYLTTHLDHLADLSTVTGPTPGPDEGCYPSSTTTYRFQIGYADGGISQVAGFANPSCVGRLRGGDLVTGPDGLGAFGAVMAAYGEQHADAFADTSSDTPLVCPDPQTDLAGLEQDGASSGVATGYRFGTRTRMLMPLTAVRGVLCTWPPGAELPTASDLAAGEAERIRIGMHTLNGAMADCGGDPAGARYVAVLEDRTGTRRAVSINDGACSEARRSDGWFGLGFDWFDR